VQALLADDPLQEQHHRDAMRLLAATGRREAALAQFERCRTALRAELGLAPMAETDALAAALRGPASATPRSAPAPAAVSRPARVLAERDGDALGPSRPRCRSVFPSSAATPR
jgi:DNA-binding SARP family transcriptional activator